MNERQEMATVRIISILAELPWDERSDVFHAVEFNDGFCVECGMDTETYGCQCQNES